MYDQLRLDNQLCFRIYTLSRLMVHAYRPLLDPLGLTYPQYLTLLTLWERDNQLVGDLCRRLGLDTNTLTPLLQRMEKQGLVVRTRGIADGRQTLVSLTKKGRALEEEAKEVPKCLIESWQSNPLLAEQAALIISTLDKMINTLKK